MLDCHDNIRNPSLSSCKIIDNQVNNIPKPVIHYKPDIMRMVQLEQRVLDLENQIAEVKVIIIEKGCGK